MAGPHAIDGHEAMRHVEAMSGVDLSGVTRGRRSDRPLTSGRHTDESLAEAPGFQGARTGGMRDVGVVA